MSISPAVQFRTWVDARKLTFYSGESQKSKVVLCDGTKDENRFLVTWWSTPHHGRYYRAFGLFYVTLCYQPFSAGKKGVSWPEPRTLIMLEEFPRDRQVQAVRTSPPAVCDSQKSDSYNDAWNCDVCSVLCSNVQCNAVCSSVVCWTVYSAVSVQ